MQPSKRYRSWFVGLSLGVLIALLLWPTTRWLVVSQFGLTLNLPSAQAPLSYLGLRELSGQEDAERAVQTFAARHPNDFQIQLANAARRHVSEKDGTPAMQRLRALETQFPDSPSLYANTLRLATLKEVRIKRDEDSLLTDSHEVHRSGANQDGNTLEQLAQFDKEAEAGERLDPNNAYFSFMRAVGLFAAKRDDEALEAMRRAAEKPRWEEYYNDHVEGEWQLQEGAFGHPAAILRVASSAALLFPHYAQFRSAGRVAIYRAVEVEKAGKSQEGLEIRRAVLQCGSRMRVQSCSLIGSMVGIALTHIAVMRPGGALPLPSEKATTNKADEKKRREERTARELRDFDAYLQQSGFVEESAPFHTELLAGDKARAIARRGIEVSPFNTGPLVQLILCWIISLLALSCALWMLGIGGLAALAGRNRRIREGKPLPNHARRGIGAGLCCGMLAAMLPFVEHSPALGYYFVPGLLLSASVMLFPARTWADWLRGLSIFALSAMTAFLTVSLCIWQSQGNIAPIARIGVMLSNSEGGGSAGDGDIKAVLALATCIIIGLPLLTTLAFGIISAICRVPMSVGFVRGFRACATPIAGLLLLVYGGLTLVTLRHEMGMNEGLKRTVQHEGRYLAELLGEAWPGK